MTGVDKTQVYGLLLITAAMAVTAGVQIVRGVGNTETWLALFVAALAAWRRGPSTKEKPDVAAQVVQALKAIPATNNAPQDAFDSPTQHKRDG